MLGNLWKAAVAVALTPVAAVADVVTLPASAESLNRGPFDKTRALLKAAGENIKKAVSPE